MDLQAVIFDYGEVLSGPPDPEAHRELLAIAGVPEEPFEKAYWVHRLDYDADILNGQTYWQTVARDTGANFTAEQIAQLLEVDARMWGNLNPAMIAWIPRIKAAGFRLGILSNMGHGVLEYLRPRFSWLDQFDQLTWSCDLRVVKPDPAIYRHVAEILRQPPTALMSVGDDPRNDVEGPRKAGWQAMQIERPKRDLWTAVRAVTGR